MKTLKRRYNEKLNRYYNGCKYIEKHREEADKWISEILKIQNEMEDILQKIQTTEKVEKEEILEGFKL